MAAVGLPRGAGAPPIAPSARNPLTVLMVVFVSPSRAKSLLPATPTFNLLIAILNKSSMQCCWPPLLQRQRLRFPPRGARRWMKCRAGHTGYIAHLFMRHPALLISGRLQRHWMKSNECILAHVPPRGE